MHYEMDRRQLIMAGGTAGLTGLLLRSGRLRAAELLTARGFTHNVASGEPAADSILLWTRYVPPGGDGPVRLDVELASDPDFARKVASASTQTGAYRDWTAKLTVDGLDPGTPYWYRFIAPDGSRSPVGRTKTLPVGDVQRFGLALFSCADLPLGWFNAYRHAAERPDLDLWLHVGDYIYEYGLDAYGPERLATDRIAALGAEMPRHEMVHLADYRAKYACWRSDPDLQALHQRAPMVALWDDHETANNSWQGGAKNHQPGTEGDWDTRRNAGVQAYREWMPVSEEPWKAYDLGTLATLYRTDSRLIGRTRQLDDVLGDAFRQPDPDTALKDFRDGAWVDRSATMLGFEQENWLHHALRANARTTAWQMVGVGTVVGRSYMPRTALDWLPADATPAKIESFRQQIRCGELGIPMSIDAWDGYPAARSRLLAAAQSADADLVMLTGDSHCSWAFSLTEDGKPAGVEFATTSVTSPGWERGTAIDPKILASQIKDASPELDWADTSQRGYVMLDITPERITGEWSFMQTIKARSTALSAKHHMSVDRGTRKFRNIG